MTSLSRLQFSHITFSRSIQIYIYCIPFKKKSYVWYIYIYIHLESTYRFKWNSKETFFTTFDQSCQVTSNTEKALPRWLLRRQNLLVLMPDPTVILDLPALVLWVPSPVQWWCKFTLASIYKTFLISSHNTSHYVFKQGVPAVHLSFLSPCHSIL